MWNDGGEDKRKRGVLPLVSMENELFSAKDVKEEMLASVFKNESKCLCGRSCKGHTEKAGKPSPPHSNGGLMRKVSSGSDL